MRTALWLLLSLLLLAAPVRALELILPQNRTAFYTREPIELAVAGLDNGKTCLIRLMPQGKPDGPFTPGPVQVPVTGDGGTVLAILPPYSLAHGDYELSLRTGDSIVQAKPGVLKVRHGVHTSNYYTSQTTRFRKDRAGANFVVGNAFSFGLLDRNRMPALDVRGRLSHGMRHFEGNVAENIPVLCYMYWTGYVLHKPWGVNKSWSAPQMQINTRLFNFHVAQRLRRFDDAILFIGSIDEPGLNWGPTPAGGAASGFPNWDSRPWYEARGWKFTYDPGARSDEDWLKYVRIRCGILGETFQQAARDIKTVWPTAVYSTDCYAPHAIMDGTDPLNQRGNDIPSSHVFMDWGWGKLGGCLSGVQTEKCDDPLRKLAHAMNGQLFGATVPVEGQLAAYRLMQNAMFAAGLRSNWWLNTRGMTADSLRQINDAATHMGSLFQEMNTWRHDIALLWGFSELAMREKEIARREAKKTGGEQIKLMVSSWPEDTKIKDNQVVANAYNVGQNYTGTVLHTHQALSRAGYPAHIVHERILPQVLDRYKVLFIAGQTVPLPEPVMAAVKAWVARGGRIVVDHNTTVKLPGAVRVDTGITNPGFYWGSYFGRVNQALKDKDAGKHGFDSIRDAGYYHTNYFMDTLARQAVEPLRRAMTGLGATRVLADESVHLAGERHVGGQAMLYLVINANDELPKDWPADKPYHIYNYAPLEATFTLLDLPPDCVAYCIEGEDWKTVSQVKDPKAPQKKSFLPGEMKLYLVAPRAPSGFGVDVAVDEGALLVNAQLMTNGQPMRAAWPITLRLTGPDGRKLEVRRATYPDGSFRETLPVGANAKPGRYKVEVLSECGKLAAEATVSVGQSEPAVQRIAQPVRVFDEATVRDFLAGRPSMVVPYSKDSQKPIAERLARMLTERGIRTEARPEKDVWRKALYPRVWDPIVTIQRAGEQDKEPDGVKRRLKIESAEDGRTVVTDEKGKDVDTWKQPGTLLTVTGKGYTDIWSDRFYDRGVQLFVNEKRRVQVVSGKPERVEARAEVRERWARPWTRLGSYVGAVTLIPQLPEAYHCEEHLVLIGDSRSGELLRALQASELLLQVADEQYPGPGKAVVQFAWSPFALEKNVIVISASDEAGVRAGIAELLRLAR